MQQWKATLPKQICALVPAFKYTKIGSGNYITKPKPVKLRLAQQLHIKCE